MSLHLYRPIPESSLSGPCLNHYCILVDGRLPVCSLALSLAELLDGDAVHVHGALLGQALSHGDAAALLRLVLGLANDASLHELLEAVADVLSSGLSGVLSLHAAALDLATVVLAEALDANLLPHVKLVADGGGARVKPVIVERAKLEVERDTWQKVYDEAFPPL